MSEDPGPAGGDTIPNPGSNEALARGCTCPVMDNAHGRGRLGLGRDYWITTGCPLHCPYDQKPD